MDLPLPMPHDLPNPALLPRRGGLRGLIAAGADADNMSQPAEGGGLSIEGPPPAWLADLASEIPAQLVHWQSAHSLANSRDLHLLTMATGVLLSLLTGKTELVVRGVYGAGKTQCIALLAAYFALGDTMSTMRLAKTQPSRPWLPLCIVSCRELQRTPPQCPSGSFRGLSEIQTAIIPSGMRDWSSQPPGYT